MKTSEADILIIPGWSSSGPDHWQTRWEKNLKTARRVEQVVDVFGHLATAPLHTSYAIFTIADLATHRPRGRVVSPRTGGDLDGVEMVKDQSAHRLPHGRADPLPLKLLTQPGTCFTRPRH